MQPDLEKKLRKATEAAFERWEKAGRRVPLKFVAEYRAKGGTLSSRTGVEPKVDQPIQKAELERTEIGSSDPKSGPVGPEIGSPSPAEMAMGASWIAKLTQKALERESSWSRVRAGLADDAMTGSALTEIRARVKADERAAEDSRNRWLPGYVSLPEKINGRGIGLATVKQFVAYAKRYSDRAVKYRSTEEEIAKLLKIVEPLVASEPKLTLAEAVQRTRGKLAVIEGGAGK